jgi:hypothetical protein
MATKNLSVKVSEKGCLSLYGVRRLPVSFYAEEWGAIGAAMPAILKFIKANRTEMADRSDATRKERGGRFPLGVRR